MVRRVYLGDKKRTVYAISFSSSSSVSATNEGREQRVSLKKTNRTKKTCISEILLQL